MSGGNMTPPMQWQLQKGSDERMPVSVPVNEISCKPHKCLFKEQGAASL